MLSTHAYSFRKKATLAILLSWIGGFTNVLTYLSCNKTFTSHVTGSATNFGRALGESEFQEAFFYAALLLSFFLGAVASSFIMQTARRLGKRSNYVVPLGFEASLLCVMMFTRGAWPQAGPVPAGFAVLGSFAMGLQNATISHISGKEIRTTHLTGVLTDLGLEGVQYGFWYWEQGTGKTHGDFRKLIKLSSHHPTGQRLLVLGAIFVSFLTGVILATLAFPRVGTWAFSLPVFFLTYLIVEDWRRPILDIREIDPFHDADLELHGLIHSVLPPELGIYRSIHHQEKVERAPNFQLWIERIPHAKSIIILVVSPFLIFDSNTIMDLERVHERLTASHRKLILAGVTPFQYRALDKLGLIGKIGRSAVFPDLEFAIAEAATLLKASRQSGY